MPQYRDLYTEYISALLGKGSGSLRDEGTGCSRASPSGRGLPMIYRCMDRMSRTSSAARRDVSSREGGSVICMKLLWKGYMAKRKHLLVSGGPSIKPAAAPRRIKVPPTVLAVNVITNWPLGIPHTSLNQASPSILLYRKYHAGYWL